MMKPILLVCFVISIQSLAHSQSNVDFNDYPIRSFDTQKSRSFDKEPDDETADDLYNRNLESIENQIKSAEKETTIQPISLSLIFHLLHTDDHELATSQIQNQIDALNRDFSNKSFSANHPNDPDGRFHKLSKDSKIKFNVKTGSIPDAKDELLSIPANHWNKWDDMKQLSTGGIRAERPQQYINIWVAHLPEGISSYASSIYRDINSQLDGIVLDAKYFSQDPNSPYSQGKTLTHLMGNYLGLYDLWADDRHCQDDYVEDTPIHNSLNYGKPSHLHVTICPEENYAPEMVMNFMDNSDDELQTMFTTGQVLRMHTILNLFRQGLLNSNN